MPFPDIEVVLMDGLEAEFAALGPGDTGRVTPANINTRGREFVRVARIGGRDDRVTDYPVVDIDVFAPTRQRARDLAEGVRSWLLRYPVRVGTVTLDRVVTETAPFQAPWEGDNVSRYLATYRISTRR